MPDHYTTTGTLAGKKTLIPDQPIPLPDGRVRITVETLPSSENVPRGITGAAYLTWLNALHQTLRASGYQPRTKAQIDAQIQTERESWGA